ncbi:NADH-dependent flavin oxidoreductase [Neisseria animalis]|uniref:NADH-dependent flavin oxidoreductase n=1 Tax=Neisseria animalis TaxID=492 RepID=A0A5P3MW52_NEIAN|nr:NADH-dependent flavin oxidoreductase [Neisseria animalis]QEY24991.1 NADH-dependent flavin oxidoreductase [Neisseria animalis]ROW32699.1 NADH-dependent flavin oxidoreductase [Neisseria animalis]
MNPKFAPLFTPYTLNNGVTIKNRLVVAPMTHWASNDDGTMSEPERHFLQGKANGFGLFISAATLVHSKQGKAFEGQPYAFAEHHLPSLRQVADLARQGGAKAVLQIHHGGAKAITDNAVAPSATENARELSAPEIDELVQAFAFTAKLAIRAGFDGVEIMGCNGFLIQQFSSRQTNRRTDKWGKPSAFPLAVTQAVIAAREQAGRPDFIIGYRLSPEEAGGDGLTMADTLDLLDKLAELPIQYLHVSLWDFDKKARRGADTSRTRMDLLHERLNGRLPLIGVGNLRTPQRMLEAFKTGWAEFLALGKAVLMNPDLVHKLQNGQEATIQTEVDLAQPDCYRFPERLWAMQQKGLAFLPPNKGSDWQPVDL